MVKLTVSKSDYYWPIQTPYCLIRDHVTCIVQHRAICIPIPSWTGTYRPYQAIHLSTTNSNYMCATFNIIWPIDEVKLLETDRTRYTHSSSNLVDHATNFMVKMLKIELLVVGPSSLMYHHKAPSISPPSSKAWRPH